MTFQPTTKAKEKQDEKGMAFQPSVTMSKKKATDDVQARAKVARDIQANLAQVRALSSGAAPTAAVRTPVRPQRAGLDMVAMARVFAAFVQSQGSDTSVRHEIAQAKREVQALAQRVAADREARRLTGRV
jgi:hypothetical protein